MVVGWYHSHPGFGCWLSSVDINTQQVHTSSNVIGMISHSPLQSFEQMQSRCVAVVIDPIQSVKGKVVIDAFRLINPQTVIAGREPRQTTSNIGHINKPSIQALVHGLNRHYYSIAVNYRKTELEQSMLMNLHKRNWTEGLKLHDFCSHKQSNEADIKVLLTGSAPYLETDITGVSENANAVLGVQQICAGGVDTISREAQDTTCRQARSQTAFGRNGRKSNRRPSGAEFGHHVTGRNIEHALMHADCLVMNP